MALYSYGKYKSIFNAARFPNILVCLQQQSCKFHVTLENIYENENKERCQKLFTNAPYMYSKVKKHNYKRTSAVLVPLCHVNGEPSVMFMVRSHHTPSHRGDVSFPGGMTDEGDESHFHTAIREAEEEVGLHPSTVDVWGHMTSFPARNSILTTPVVAYCGDIDVTSLKPCDKEVETVFTRTIHSLCHPDNIRQTTFRGFRSNTLTTQGYTMPIYLGGQHRIWGLTAVFLHNLLTVIAPEVYSFKLKHPRLHHDKHIRKS